MILITGGAGYIGSHTNKLLHSHGIDTIVFDNLICGHQEFVKWGKFFLGDLSNIEQIRQVFRQYPIKAVVHFAAYAYVGESIKEPQKYYLNNVAGTLNLLCVMREFECSYLVFSSTCAIYGVPNDIPIKEDHIQNPINPYGRSKLMVEKILKDYSDSYGLKCIVLRYFNAAGADVECEIGERHNPETHLIPLAIEVLLGKRSNFNIYGDNYPTKDGTCIRDFIHVSDLANAHLLALKHLYNGAVSDVFNLGNGEGYSVYDVVKCLEKLYKKKIPLTVANKRKGDPAVLVGSSEKAKSELNWKPRYPDLETIIETAYNWHKK